MASIEAQHTSMIGMRRVPKRMARVVMDSDQREFIDNYAIEIFTDCVNQGHTFQSALAAIYLSGLQNGSEISESAARRARGDGK